MDVKISKLIAIFTFGAAIVNITTVLYTTLYQQLCNGPRGVLTLRVEGTV